MAEAEPISIATLWWVVPVAVITVASVLLRSYLVAIPVWLPPVVAGVAIALASVAA